MIRMMGVSRILKPDPCVARNAAMGNIQDVAAFIVDESLLESVAPGALTCSTTHRLLSHLGNKHHRGIHFLSESLPPFLLAVLDGLHEILFPGKLTSRLRSCPTRSELARTISDNNQYFDTFL